MGSSMKTFSVSPRQTAREQDTRKPDGSDTLMIFLNIYCESLPNYSPGTVLFCFKAPASFPTSFPACP